MTRLLVALAPRVELGERIELHQDPIEVGVVHWHARTSMMAVILRARYALSEGRASVVKPSTWVLGRSGASAPFPGPMFVPYKPDCDVVLRGSATVASRGPGLNSPAKIALGGRSVRLALPGSDAPLGTKTRFDLGRGFLLGPDGLPGIDAPPPAVALSDRPEVDPTDDYTRFQAASPGLRFNHPNDGDLLELEGLTYPGDVFRFVLPTRRPRLLIDRAAPGSSLEVLGLVCDTLAVDVDARTVDVVWRGSVEIVQSYREIEKVVVLIAERADATDDPESDFIEDLRELPRGTFFHATEIQDAERGSPPPALEPAELTMARFDAWSPAAAPSPSIKLDTYVEISATLCEQKGSREETLRRFDLDEYGWALEERAWSELLASLPRADEETTGLHADYARLVKEHSARLADPEEQRVSPEDYGAIIARMERTDPAKVITDAGWGLGSWMRIDERMTALAERDPVVEKAIRKASDDERRRMLAERKPDDEEWENDDE